VPLFAHMGAWGRRHMPVTHELSVRAELLENGGQELWDDYMDELRVLHLGAPPKSGRQSVMERLQHAYLQAVADR
jgi:hypothetical protein